MPSERCAVHKEYHIINKPWYNIDNFVNEIISYLQEGVTKYWHMALCGL